MGLDCTDGVREEREGWIRAKDRLTRGSDRGQAVPQQAFMCAQASVCECFRKLMGKQNYETAHTLFKNLEDPVSVESLNSSAKFGFPELHGKQTSHREVQ